MEKKELLSIIDNFGDDTNKKVFAYLVEYVSDIKDDICEVKDEVKKQNKISIINGEGDGVRSEIDAGEFHQLMYNRITKNAKDLKELDKKKQDRGMLKTTVKSINWWADNIIKIILLLAALFGWIAYHDITTTLNTLPK